MLAEARKQSSVLFFIVRRSLSTPLIDLIAYYAKSRNRTELHAQASVESQNFHLCSHQRTLATESLWKVDDSTSFQLNWISSISLLEALLNIKRGGYFISFNYFVLQYGRHKTSEVLASPPYIFCLPKWTPGTAPASVVAWCLLSRIHIIRTN